jgi:hypothetical protein
LASEFLDFAPQKGYWMLLPYELVKELIGVGLSPIGVVPQRDWCPRVIVDYSFHAVNGDTIKLSPEESMQFGKAMERLLQANVAADPAHGPNVMYKVDISDGFYRIPLSTPGILKLGVLLLYFPGLPALVAFPLVVLPMGWTESPPFFCCFTETICDLVNEGLRKNIRFPAHRLETHANAQDFAKNPDTGHATEPLRPVTASHSQRLRKKPTAYVDVLVDDFCGVGQDIRMNPLANQRRTLLETPDSESIPYEKPGDRPDPEAISSSTRRLVSSPS